MNLEYLPYIVTEFFCIIFALTLFVRLKCGLGSEREIQILRIMLILFIVSAITEVFWALCEGNILIPEHYINAVINTISLIAVALGCYAWYRFVGERLKSPYLQKKRIKTLLDIPIIFICVLDVISIFSEWIFYIDASGHYRLGDLFGLQGSVTFFYLLLPVLDSIIHIFKPRVKSQRMECLAFVLYMIIPFFAVLVQDSIPTVPIFSLSVFVVIQVLFLTIYVDREKELMLKEKELDRSRMAIMLSQIQPHFLYNSLSAIQDMCHDKAPEAEEATIAFSQFLRGNLDSLSQSKPIPFAQELAHTNNYLALEEKRFGPDILRVEYAIATEDFCVPALTLQPIVENAVRYGVMQREDGGTVKIATTETDDAYLVTVDDDGVGFDIKEPKPDGRTHIGISNVRSRLIEMCGGDLNITSVRDQGTHALITIPKAGNESEKAPLPVK